MSVAVRYQEKIVAVNPGETLLVALEREGLPVTSSCRAGVCQTCLMRAVEGNVPRRSQEGLKESLKLSGHFLPCLCVPEESFTCVPASSCAFQGETSILGLDRIARDVMRVKLRRPESFCFEAGQFITLRRGSEPARSYSLASSPRIVDSFEIHVRCVPGGKFSSWIHGQAQVGDALHMEGPKGDCQYYPNEPHEPLVFAGIGTGIAPLYAIVQEALAKGHLGKITVVHGGLRPERLYLVKEWQQLACEHSNVEYIACVKEMEGESEILNVVVGDLRQVLVMASGDLGRARFYLCGDAEFVRTSKRQLFLKGASLKRIHADPFIGVAESNAPQGLAGQGEQN